MKERLNKNIISLNIEPTRPIKPTVYAQKCPQCNGYGTVSYGTKVCDVCLGKKYILVPLERPKEDFR